MFRLMLLRGVLVRLVSVVQYSFVNYIDLDSDDGGVFLVREDIDFIQDQGFFFLLVNVLDEVFLEGDVSFVNDIERDDIISLEENQFFLFFFVVEGEGFV